jgi:ankyrin repeat protein
MMPNAVDSIIAGEVKSLEEMRGLAPSVMEWVEASLPLAHQTPEIKTRLERLLGAPLLVPNLAHFGLWDHLIEECKARALELGQEMQQYFEENSLGIILGEAFIPNLCGKFQAENGDDNNTISGPPMVEGLRAAQEIQRQEHICTNKGVVQRSHTEPALFERQRSCARLKVVPCASDKGERRQDGAMPTNELGFGFPRNLAHSQLWNEKCFIHCLRMVAMGIDESYQKVVNEVCTRSNGCFKATAIKGYVRMLNKCVSKDDHYWEEYPRPSLNIDLNRNACTFPESDDLLLFIKNMKDHPMIDSNPVRIKNMFLFDKARAEKQFFYRTVMINWLYTPGLTYGELAERAKPLWERYRNFAVVSGYGEKDPSASVGTWRKQIDVAVAYLKSPELKDKPVQFIVETQLLLHPYLVGRQKMHLLYKIYRADNPGALHSEFLKSTADAKTSFDDMEERALAETIFFLSKSSAVNCQHEEHKGATHLWLRAKQGHAKAVHAILQHPQVDPNVVRKDTGTTPLFIASHHGHEEVVKAILGHRTTHVNRGKLGTNTSPLYQAVQGGHEGVVEAILAVKGVDVNQAITTGNTPLGKACELGNEHIVRLLLSAEGINVNSELQGGNTAFSIASQNNHAGIADMLLAHPGMASASRSNQIRPMAPSTDQLKQLSENVGTSTTNLSMARKVSEIRIPIEEPKLQNASPLGPPNEKVNAPKGKPRVQKLPAWDRNIETVTAEELTKSQCTSQRR